MGRKVLIVGGVAGGATAATRLRRLDETADIVIFERGPDISYANCGLPYRVGDVVKTRDALVHHIPSTLWDKYRVDARTGQEVIGIDRDSRSITVRKVDSGETYSESYDSLLLTTGSSPVRPPIQGIDSRRVLTLWTLEDAERIRLQLEDDNAKHAVVVGGGFVGLETAENLRHFGLEVTVVEMLDQVMAPLDPELAQLLHEHLEANGVALHLGDGVSSFSDSTDGIIVKLASGIEMTADVVILCIGVKPNGELATAAGLEVNSRGGIVVDEYLRTSDPNIWAAGDVIEVEDFASKGRTMIPLAGPANKQARIVAGNICGAQESYGGTQGTAIVRVFDLSAAVTGTNEKALKQRGLERGKDYQVVTVRHNSHAGYYGGATPLNLKLLFSTGDKKILGAQIVGRSGVDKRIDVIATAMRLNGSTDDLKQLELAYAPPYSTVRDIVNIAGFAAEDAIKAG